MIELGVLPADAPDRQLEHDLTGALPWLGLEEALEESRATRKPILCVAEHPLSNSAQRLALFLEQDDRLRSLAADQFVPLLVDPGEHPELTDRILHAAHQLEDEISPPILAVLTEEGLPLVTSCSIAFEGTPERPSLQALLQAAAGKYGAARKKCLVEARGLQQTTAFKARNLFLPVWQLLRKHDGRLLNELLTAGIRDQLGGGFHRAARVSGWGVPHFEKLAVQNAGMAAVLARSGDPELIEEARECAGLADRALLLDSAGLASDTAYYTWHAAEILQSLPADELHMIGTHYRISASDSRHVLNQVRSVAQTSELATGHDPASTERLLRAGKRRLLEVRNTRPAPAALPAMSLTHSFTTVNWLLQASRFQPDLTHAERHLERLVRMHGQLTENANHPLHTQVAALQALETAASCSDDPLWHRSADHVRTTIMRDCRTNGVWLSRPGGAVLTGGRVDGDLPSVLTELKELAIA